MSTSGGAGEQPASAAGSPSPVDLLLAGPRGRRTLSRLTDHSPHLLRWPPFWFGDHVVQDLGAGRTAHAALVQELTDAVAATNTTALARTADPVSLLGAVLDAVNAARYWQEPDGDDELLADPHLGPLLRPAAEAVLRAPAAAWWSDGVDLTDQHHVQRHHDSDDLSDDPDPVALNAATAAEHLARWRRDTVADEQRAARERPQEVTASSSGFWWSTPAPSDLLCTTPSIPSARSTGGHAPDLAVPEVPGGHRPPVGVVLVEDSSGWPTLTTRQVRLRPGLRVYEIDGPAAWIALVEAHPLRVTRSRRHDWYRATGWSGSWVMPDWVSVAREWDGVHPSVLGYLSTAGRALVTSLLGESGPAGAGLEAGTARTLLAGWDPGTTWWLTDAVTGFLDAIRWRIDDTQELALGWQPTSR
ncbi:hypothetical protein SAMN06264364_1557 [Quadrisphaera granulorum]|uniref:Uncharacterized protein n=1 Tax=Quadrisphaera granulorum TaxID=317664 RepID=A0A315ZJA0_9ACTN|nr:hypothetical protein [Quadrisphaera granulorum]PWJ45556.1 hypothetical protein BXY45_1557 [Quadrisphaera granulorum]SZE99171.1 hypothetical protein SAMN06264364_1557 [Quadrisphaera granulorum]